MLGKGRQIIGHTSYTTSNALCHSDSNTMPMHDFANGRSRK